VLQAAWHEVELPVDANPDRPLVVRFAGGGCARPADVAPGKTDPRCLALGLGRVSWVGAR